MKVNNLISLFTIIDIPITARALFIYFICASFFSFANAKRHYIDHLHREEFFLPFLIVNIFKVRFFVFQLTSIGLISIDI